MWEIGTECYDVKVAREYDINSAGNTYSVLLHKLAPDAMSSYIHNELDKVALAHATFTDDALALIVRSSEGVLRRARNLCLGSLLEAVRDRTKTVDLKQVNRVLLQPHWRKEAPAGQ